MKTRPPSHTIARLLTGTKHVLEFQGARPEDIATQRFFFRTGLFYGGMQLLDGRMANAGFLSLSLYVSPSLFLSLLSLSRARSLPLARALSLTHKHVLSLALSLARSPPPPLSLSLGAEMSGASAGPMEGAHP